MLKNFLSLCSKYKAANIIGVITAIVVATLTVFVSDRDDPVRIVTQKIVPEIVTHGQTQTVYIHWEAYVLRNCPGTVTRRFTDSRGIVYEYAPTPTILRTNEEVPDRTKLREFARPILLPDGISPGRVKHELIGVKYYCNWTHYVWPISPQRPAMYFEVRLSPK